VREFVAVCLCGSHIPHLSWWTDDVMLAAILCFKVIASLKPKLNAFDVEVVTEQLRDAFRAEHEGLLEDVEYLHQCLQVGELSLVAHAMCENTHFLLSLMYDAQTYVCGGWIMRESFPETQAETEAREVPTEPQASLNELSSFCQKLEHTWIEVMLLKVLCDPID
jgi:hypothetical protein